MGIRCFRAEFPFYLRTISQASVLARLSILPISVRTNDLAYLPVGAGAGAGWVVLGLAG